MRRPTRSDLVLGIDQGSGGTTALLVDAAGVIRARADVPVRTHFPEPGRAEQDPDEIFESVVSASRLALRQRPAGTTVRGLGLAVQRSTTVFHSKRSGQRIYRAISWQDVRTAERVEELAKKPLFSTRFPAITGLRLMPHFAATKIAWAMRENTDVKRAAMAGDLLASTLDAFIVRRLTDGSHYCTDASMAARTGLFDIGKGAWSAPILKALAIPKSILPDVVTTVGLRGSAKALEGLPILAAVGDQSAALVGAGALSPGEGRITAGTGLFALLHAGTSKAVRAKDVFTTLLWTLPGPKGPVATFGIEANTPAAGAFIEWMVEPLRLFPSALELLKAARVASSSGGVTIVPTLSGMGAPHFAAEGRALVAGLSRATGLPEIARATVEGIAHLAADLVECVEKAAKKKARRWVLDGGLAREPLFSGLVADALGRPIAVAREVEATAYGAALLALHAARLRPLSAPAPEAGPAQTLRPSLTPAGRTARRKTWGAAVEAAVRFATAD
jgi:glycerol kinase